MIRMIQSRSANNAKEYFSDSLQRSDYYLDDQELKGLLRGRIAERLKIQGEITKNVFHALCENIHPKSGIPLTKLKKANRTVGYDINFHCPKSVSVLHALSKDSHILEAFHRSVLDTMNDIEQDAQTRVRKNGKDENRSSDGLLYADFIHQTARPVKDELPDPHLHCHCFVFNVTWDQVEEKFKAGQFRNIKRDMPYYQALFHKRLSDNLMGLGYKIRTTKAAFEIEGVPEHIIDLFSKRTNEIGQLAKDQQITDAKELDQLGGRTRAKKKKGLTIPELRAYWIEQIKEMGFDLGLKNTVLRFAQPIKGLLIKARNAVDYALDHQFERASVVPERKLLESAIRYAIGCPRVTISGIEKIFGRNKNIIKSQDEDGVSCSTVEIVKEELAIVELVNQTKGQNNPAYQTPPTLTLEGEQAAAIHHVLTTPDPVSIIMGRAGTGKTSLMREAVAKFTEAGKSVLVVAPTAEASRGVLRQEGFAGAETVAKLLSDKALHDQLTDQVLWVDEAGLLGTRDMLALLRLAQARNAQLILSGDTKQHTSVARGDALRLLDEVAGVKPVGLSTIRRQKREQYRSAVEALSMGNVVEGYQALASMGAIQEVDPQDTTSQLVDQYVSLRKRKKSVLVVSPTHHQCGVVTEAIRKTMREKKLIGKQDKLVSQLISLNLTEAERTEKKSYQKGLMIRVNRKTESLKAHSYAEVTQLYKDSIELTDKNGGVHLLHYEDLKQAEVYRKAEIALAKGDKIRATRNGMDKEKRRINNGQELMVKSINQDGSIVAESETTKCQYFIGEEFRHIQHAYCLTSHASQGKTVDVVLVSQPTGTFAATDLKQFYVSASRGRYDLKIYTDDQEGLLDHVAVLKKRKSALELLNFQDNGELIAGIADYETPSRQRNHAGFIRPLCDLLLGIILYNDKLGKLIQFYST
jgi:conjugative relaxase-like TrwC/TraI family protein